MTSASGDGLIEEEGKTFCHRRSTKFQGLNLDFHRTRGRGVYLNFWHLQEEDSEKPLVRYRRITCFLKYLGGLRPKSLQMFFSPAVTLYKPVRSC